MTENFKLECKEPAYANRLGKIFIDENNSISNDDFLVNYEVLDDCYVNGSIIGTTNAKSITINTLDNYELADDEIQAQIGVKYDDNSTEYIGLGKYLISKENNAETLQNGKYEGLDSLSKLDTEYVCGITDYETVQVTIADVYSDLCTTLGFTPKTLNFINSDLPVYGNPYTNKEKFRDVLSDIAEVACSFVELDRITGEIDLVWFDTEVAEVFTKDDYSTLTKNKKYGVVNCLVIKESQIEGENVVEQDDESIALNGETQIAIIDNYFLNTEELRRQALPAIWDRIKGFTYYDCSITTDTGKPYLKRGNKITIEDNDGNYFDTYVLKHTFKYDGAFHSIIESPALTNEETRIKNNIETPKTKFRRVEVQVDKINGQIESVIESNDEITTKLSDVVQNIDSITSTIQITGGSNLINNSVKLFGENLWENTEIGEFTSGYDQTLVGKTVSASKVQVKGGTTKTAIDNITNLVVGQSYTLSYMLSNDADTTCTIRLIGNNAIYEETVTEKEILKEYSVSFEATTANAILEITSSSIYDGGSLITDLMLCKGDKKTWEPASGEVNSTVMKFYRLGLIVYATGSDTAVMLGSQGLDIRDYDGTNIGERVTYFDKYGTKTKKVECTEITQQDLVNKNINVNSKNIYIRYIRSN